MSKELKRDFKKSLVLKNTPFKNVVLETNESTLALK